MGVMPSQQFSLNCNINTSGRQKAEQQTITTRTQVLLQMLKQQTPPPPPPPEERVGGWAGQIRSGQIMADGNKNLKSETPRDLNLHRTLEPTLPAVCDKNHTSLKIRQGCHKLASNDSII